MPSEFITFGAVHLNVIDLKVSLQFWRDIIGLQVREETSVVELGTKEETLIVLHSGATHKVLPGFSGLYHLAIHLPTEPEFARVLARLITLRQAISPTDHIMSKALYLNDPDGIGLELTLETPERLKSWVIDANGYPEVIDVNGEKRSGRDPLDVEEILRKLPYQEITQPMPEGTKIGHIHLHVGDLKAADGFYKELGFIENSFSFQIGMADLHAGGDFKHRIAFNTWEGEGAPQPPEGTAGLAYFKLLFDSKERLEAALKRVSDASKSENGYTVLDPAGNKLWLGVR